MSCMTRENWDNKESSSDADLRSTWSWEAGFGVPMRGVADGVFGDWESYKYVVLGSIYE